MDSIKKKEIGILVVIVGIILCCGCIIAPEMVSPTGTLTGFVSSVDVADLSNTEIVLTTLNGENPISAFTNSAGNFTFQNIPTDTYFLSAALPLDGDNYLWAEIPSIEVLEGEQDIGEIPLVRLQCGSEVPA